MFRDFLRIPAAAALTLAAPLGLGVAAAPAAHAAQTVQATTGVVHPNCTVDEDGKCVPISRYVTGTSEASPYLNIRSGPGTGYTAIGQLPYQSTAPAFCWAVGANVNGNPYWDYIRYNGLYGYVSDYWLYTGGDITTQVGPC